MAVQDARIKVETLCQLLNTPCRAACIHPYTAHCDSTNRSGLTQTRMSSWHLQGEIPTLLELPAPWGPKAYVSTSADAAHSPAHFPGDFSPLKDSMQQILAA